jgi:hypothetical protein
VGRALLVPLVLWPALAAAQIPVLHVSPAILVFSAAPSAPPPVQQVRIRNLGSGLLRWSITAADPWVRASPASGTGPAVITVSVDSARLGPGRHDSRLTIDAGDADDSPASVAITFELTAAAPGAAVPAAAGQEKPAPSAGTAPVAPLAEAGAPLRLDRLSLPPAARGLPYAQAIPVAGGTPPYAIRIVRGRLPVGLALTDGAIVGAARLHGVYPFVLAISDSARPPAVLTATLALRVIILLADTALIVSPPTLRLAARRGAPQAQARLGISAGRQSLDWSASADASWLSVTPSSGASPAFARIDVTAGALPPGTYTSTITVTMEGAPNSPARVPVTVTIQR